MSNQPAARAMSVAVVSLPAFGACLYMFLPPMIDETVVGR